MFYLYSIFLNMLFFEINQEINVVMKFFSSIIQNKEPDDMSLAPCCMWVKMIMIF